MTEPAEQTFMGDLRQASAALADHPDQLASMAGKFRRALPAVKERTDTTTPDGKRLVRAVRDAVRDADRAARAIAALRGDLDAAADAADACEKEQ